MVNFRITFTRHIGEVRKPRQRWWEVCGSVNQRRMRKSGLLGFAGPLYRNDSLRMEIPSINWVFWSFTAQPRRIPHAYSALIPYV